MSTPSFAGTVPDNYDRCLGPVLFEPYAEDLVARLPGSGVQRVLELACGTGIVTRRLRAALPETAALVATDLSEPMLDRAREVVGGPGIEWRQADAQALPFADGEFDVAVCQFGWMFLPDKVRGFREVRRVLRPGGTLLVNTWLSMDDNPHTLVLDEVLTGTWPDDPPRFLEIPHGYHDAGEIRADLEAAGWSDAELEVLQLEGVGPSAAEFATGWAKGSPLTHELLARDADLDGIERELAEALTGLGGEAPFTTPLGAIVITATR